MNRHIFAPQTARQRSWFKSHPTGRRHVPMSCELLERKLMLSATSTETQTFDTAASAAADGWTEIGCTRDLTNCGTDFGFSASSNAGGSAGEGGGRFSRWGSQAFYVDSDLGGNVTLDDHLTATGKVYFDQVQLTAGVNFGWYDVDPNDLDRASSTLPALGMFFAEGGRTGARVRTPPSGGIGPINGQLSLPNDIPLEFSFVYDPDDGVYGSMTYTLTNPAVPSSSTISFQMTDAIRNSGVQFNAFGLQVGGAFGSENVNEEGYVFFDNLTYSTAVQQVEIDVKPGSDPNSINVNSHGAIAVAILSDASLDATQVDATTVLFAGAFAFQNALEDVDDDGDLDMVLHFRTDETNLDAIYAELIENDVNADGVLDSSNQVVESSLTGETLAGSGFAGFDEVNLFLKGKALRDLLDDLFG